MAKVGVLSAALAHNAQAGYFAVSIDVRIINLTMDRLD
jgi:hypothetical protein